MDWSPLSEDNNCCHFRVPLSRGKYTELKKKKKLCLLRLHFLMVFSVWDPSEFHLQEMAARFQEGAYFSPQQS